MKIYDHYLFDADGTLFDTADLIYECFQYVAEKHAGKTLSRKTIIDGIGLPLRDLFITHLGPGLDYDHILDDYLAYQLEVMGDTVTLFPGVKETLQVLQDSGKQLAVVTSRRRYSLEVFLGATGISGYFDVLVTPEDTVRHKPDAEPALKAISLLDADKEKTVFTGDALYDICSGASAGIDTVFVNWSHAELSSLPVPPTWTIDTMPELTASF